ncbi:MAG: hypothetical protein KY443_00395 [Actinobacteria bacterium]|nr:hypothetical protein [Actinomycetota bacterium]
MTDDEGAAPTRLIARAVLGGALALGLVLRAWLSVTDDGMYWPDEVHKTWEPAHRVAFGYGFQAWEFVRGASNWVLAGVVGGLLWALAAVGLDDPHRYVIVLRLLFSAAALSSAYAAVRLAGAWGAGQVGSAVAGAVTALAAPLLYFSHRGLTETASLAPVTFGLWLTLRPDAGRRRWVVVGASLLGLAVLFRVHNALFCVVVLGVLAVRRDWPRVGVVAAVLAGWAALLGVVDWVTWGVPFHSVWEYGRVTFVEGVAAGFGETPAWYYLRFLFHSIGPAVVVLAVLVAVGAWRAPGLFVCGALFVGLHSVEGHKEARFVLPALPALFAVAGVGLGAVWRWRRAVGAVVALAVLVPVVFQAVTIKRLTIRDIGQDHLFFAGSSAYFHSTSTNRLLFAAHRQADLCGLRVASLEREWTGGYTYLHRDVPVYDKFAAPAEYEGRYNYLIGEYTAGDPGIVAVDGGLALQRVGGACAPPGPGYSDRLGDPLAGR